MSHDFPGWGLPGNWPAVSPVGTILGSAGRVASVEGVFSGGFLGRQWAWSLLVGFLVG